MQFKPLTVNLFNKLKKHKLFRFTTINIMKKQNKILPFKSILRLLTYRNKKTINNL